ncbi:NAD(P)/FAD-dependent oxidoreductase [Natronorarus salvus]|uniref:NAD(P)/FAD-dependent oxidoreductase n=1 Tax=Natronorarus salvus TaxID=3117733 RepID=UPI002F263B9F
MGSYDVLVAGGGPSGLQFARELGRRTEHSVGVLEANDELSENDKSTGGTFHQVVDGFDVSEEVVMDSSPEVVFEGPDASARLPIPNHVLDFPAFVEFLGERAASHGVDVLTGVRVLEPIVEDGRVVGVRCRRRRQREEVRADLVVDATGPAGALTRRLGMWDRTRAQRGIGKEFEVEGRFEEDALLFRFDHRYAPGGYAWVFPAGEGAFKIGVCWVDDFYERHARDENTSIDAYIERWIESDSRWSVESIRAVHAGEVISDNSIHRRAGDGIVAVGDSVSSINPLFGEGIRPGMESAEMAADIAIEALRAGDTSREALLGYERRWNREKGASWRRQRIVGELLYDFDAGQQNGFVRRCRSLSEEGAERLQRYELTIGDLFGLYPFRASDLPKLPRLLRHLR